MNGLDIALLVIFILAAVMGLIKGFIRIAVFWAAIIAAYILASLFYRVPSMLLRRFISPLWLCDIIAFGAVFLIVTALGIYSAFVFRKLLKRLRLLWLDRLAGSLVGLAIGLTLSTFLILFLTYALPAGNKILADSFLAPYTVEMAHGAVALIPGSVKSGFEKKRKVLKDYWKKLRKERKAPEGQYV